jgi:hypothetical protein
MSATNALSLRRASQSGRAGDAIGRLLQRIWLLLYRDRLLSGSSDTAEELLIARHGPVEIRTTLSGWSLETCVKGEPDKARATALRRLANYVSRWKLCIARPLVQTEEAAGRWRLGVALPDMDDDLAAAIARNGRVRVSTLHAQTLAVIRVAGRPTKLAMQHAETALRLALAPTRWSPAGSVMLRLYTLPAVLPFLGRFEVALPVAERTPGMHLPDWSHRLAFSQRLSREVATPASPATR